MLRQAEGQIEGWKDGQTLFCRTLPATTGAPIKKSEDNSRAAEARHGDLLFNDNLRKLNSYF